MTEKNDKIAFIGDIHGCIDEFKELVGLLKSQGISNIWHCGDLVDRGPSSGDVIQFCIDNKINGVLGNHDYGAINIWNLAVNAPEFNPKKKDKAQTLSQLNQERVDYLKDLPLLYVFDEIKTILVHGGLVNGINIEGQPKSIMNLQLINKEHFGHSRWFNKDKKGTTEQEYRAQGWERWYRLWDGDYNVVFGHSGFINPLIYTTKKGFKCIGIDTGCCFGRDLTALIMPDMIFLKVPAKNLLKDKDEYLAEFGGVEN